MKKILLLLIIFSSCQSASKLTYKAIAKDKSEVAKITREIFPCGIIARDTTVITDTIIDVIECPESDVITIIKTDTTIDTIIVKKTVKVPIITPQRTIYITQKFEDSAKIFILQKESSDKSLRILRLADRLHTAKVIIWWLIIILTLSVISFYFLNKTK